MITDKAKKYRKYFTVFFLFMFIMTLLSRFLDTLIVPKVSVSRYNSGNLNFQIEGEGVVKVSETQYVDIPEGIKVDRVLGCGEKVEAGQGIVFLRLSDLEEKRNRKERELEKLRISLKIEELNSKAAADITETERQAGSLALEEKKVLDAAAKLRKAQEEYGTKVKELEEKKKQDMEFAKRQLWYSREDIDRMNRDLGKDDQRSYAQTELDYDMAIAKIEEEYNNALEQLEERLWDASLQYNDAQDAYNQVLYNAGLAAKQDNYRAVNDKRAAQESGYRQNMLKLDIEEQEAQLRELEQLIQNNGEVVSTAAGIITKMEVVPGMAPDGEEIVEIGSGELVFTGSLPRQAMEIVEEGDAVEIAKPMGSGMVKGNIANIHIDIGAAEEEEDRYAVFTALLEGEEYRVGSKVKYTVNKSSKTRYSCLVPIEAVREDGNGKYCLIAEKQHTILGEEDIAVRINLEVLETDDRHAAVSGIFAETDRIITGGNKAIREGDRVRVQS